MLAGANDAEETFVTEARIDFAGDRLVGRTPGNVAAVKASVADDGIDAGDDGIDAEFEGRERSVAADLLGAELIDGNAADVNVFAGRFADGEAGEEIGGLGVMAVALVAVLLVEVREDEKIFFVRSERFECVRDFVIRAFFLREPIFFPNAVREKETRHADGGLDIFGRGGSGGGFGGSAEDFAHGVEEREAERDTHAAEESAAREDWIFRNVHRLNLIREHHGFAGSDSVAACTMTRG